MEVSKVSICRAMRTISSLSMPMHGRNTGSSHTAPVTAMAGMVWLATWPSDSPVMSAPQPYSTATFSAMRIINRRMMSVNSSSWHFSRISSWILVNGTTMTLMRPHHTVSLRPSSSTFSLARSEV